MTPIARIGADKKCYNGVNRLRGDFMIDRHGFLHLSGEALIGPGLREADFLASPLGATSESNGANDGWSRYIVRGTLDNGLTCAATLFFFEGRLRKLSFRPHWPGSARSWREWSEAGELRVRDQNNQLLVDYLGPPPYVFTWGRLTSDYDHKSGSSGIFVQYKEA
jgi:hypothetical protein